AGDQGMMFGYATNETKTYMPLALALSHEILQELAAIRKAGKKMTYLRPDSKSQVTIKYDDNHKPVAIDSIVVSTQHDPFDKSERKMLAQIKKDVINIVIPAVKRKTRSAAIKRLFTNKIKYHINPTGKFVIGGPHGDTGLTGRKIIVDTYGGKGAHGGGAFSGKDPSKVDRSAAYATRHIAKNMVAAKICDEVLVQVSYAIGVAKPTNIYINTYGTARVNKSDAEISEIIYDVFDMRPYAIEKRLKLRAPIYSETAAYGHMGRTPAKKKVSFKDGSGNTKTMEVETFTWEKLDYVDKLRKVFGL
ncbi:MAG: methionine adenosyltransferase, partial [Saprospiraceae bacterium]|nr:methionine adenosyltransferase [Saprospiraceae bacterium]